MFCTKCGKEMPEGATTCPNCGKGADNREINFSDVTNYAGQQMNKAVTDAKAQFNASREAYQKEQDEQKVKDLSQIIIDPQEQKIAVMGSSYLDSMLHGGGLSKGFGILTDKRFYFKGKCFIKSLGHRLLVDEEYTVDLENITASGFVYIKRIWLIILSFISLIVGFLGFVTEGEEELMLICMGAFLILLIAYFLTKKVYYEVHFEGGMIAVNISKYGGIKEVRAFNKALRLAKDKRK